MQCTNCASFIRQHDSYYKGGKNKTIFCSRQCVKEMYQDLYKEEEIEFTIEKVPGSNENNC